VAGAQPVAVDTGRTRKSIIKGAGRRFGALLHARLKGMLSTTCRDRIPVMKSSHPSSDFKRLRDALRDFAAERDWEQFHTPRNLAMAVSVEAAELLERFQWLSEAQSQSLSGDDLDRVREELADVLLYLVRLADVLGVDLEAAADAKLVLNAAKYPVELARGNARKYDER
jgi:NTP pyrophosphatase (non-canonical NTP hydrolase)